MSCSSRSFFEEPSRDSGEVFGPIYVSVLFGSTGIALHSAVLPLALLIPFVLLKLGNRDQQRILPWFLIGWFGHAVADFLTHANNARPLFWPISGWTWNSPISYYNPLHYGQEFVAISHALIMLTAAALLVRHILDGRRKSSPKNS